ncbi:chemotaxis protein CheW [Segnochrobactrum spirostomi]|uniref:Chemotaxis protein CheW n=1 Tax=Segnochrobactrum spirostomi TaxID=2608987 RepID=A0A6A7Y0Y1_9HYPH|nr:chemotaxis protein CheW [Segnochrobactrum spirostomi]MQT12730.1 chemotaxis protein CheW [Segnochrobactrum spirostomi]
MSAPLAKTDVSSETTQFVTVRIGPQLFGLPISTVHEVFAPEQITRVPLAPAEIDGVLNLRGRIVTTINMRTLLGFGTEVREGQMAVGIEHKGESFGLMIDEVGEVLSLDIAAQEPNPANLDRRWAQVSNGVYRLSKELMLVLDVERSLARVGNTAVAA